MTSPRLRIPFPVLALALAASLGGCAPDAVRPSSSFDAWSAQVAATCRYHTIGGYQVGSLLGMNATDQGVVFLDSTSRLYAGVISPDQWTLSVTGDLNGRPGDPGIACVLGQLPAR